MSSHFAAALAEGFCPDCRHLLTPQGNLGYCATCRCWWSREQNRALSGPML